MCESSHRAETVELGSPPPFYPNNNMEAKYEEALEALRVPCKEALIAPEAIDT